jgi:hypothetical protein
MQPKDGRNRVTLSQLPVLGLKAAPDRTVGLGVKGIILDASGKTFDVIRGAKPH